MKRAAPTVERGGRPLRPPRRLPPVRTSVRGPLHRLSRGDVEQQQLALLDDRRVGEPGVVLVVEEVLPGAEERGPDDAGRLLVDGVEDRPAGREPLRVVVGDPPDGPGRGVVLVDARRGRRSRPGPPG